jgi:MoaA/NifB/PqqE/SkfB family radical SAM enzyme
MLDHITGTRGCNARIFFNGMATRETAAALASAGHGRLRPLVSIDGAERINDGLRGRGDFADSIQALRNLVDAGLSPVVNTVALAPVLPSLAEMARAVSKAGATRLHLILPHMRGALTANRELLPSGEAMLAAIKEVAETAAGIGLLFDNIPSCGGV